MNAKTLDALEFDKVRRRLADYTAFSGGRRLALDLTPSTDPDEVRRRLARTSQARAFLERRVGPELGGAHDMRAEADAARRGKTLLPQELLDIRDTLAAARRLKRLLGRETGLWPDLAELAQGLDDCPALLDAIEAALDAEGQVRDEASPALGRIRRDLKMIHDRLVRHLERLVASSEAREYLQEPLVTQRSGRYVVPVKSGYRGRLPGVVHDTSDSGATVFVEPLAVVEQGNRLRELGIEEGREVARVLRELSEHVAAQSDGLAETIALLAELDLAFAAAAYAFDLKAVAPEVASNPRPWLDFREARHPLLHPDAVVAVDVWVGRDFHILVITGPNTGGKTVTLKTVGLLVLMAQSGLHIPAADGAALAVFDGVFADIGDEQSIEQSLSTFSGHLTNIIAILDQAGPGSLVLLDELGAGTDPVEGAALARALLEQLRQRRVVTVASTHYSELKVYAHATPGVANASVEFDTETLAPTFELTIGLPGRSNALAIAERLGLPAAIVADARSEVGTPSLDMEDLLAEIRDLRRQAQAERDAAQEARHRSETWAAKLEAGLRDLEGERAQALNAARAEAERELGLAREAVQAALRRAESAVARDVVATARRALDAAAEALAGREAGPGVVVPLAAGDLAPGARVRVRSFGTEGEVVEVRGSQVDVQVGRLRLAARLRDIELLAPAPPAADEVSPPVTRLHRSGPAAAPPLELDLRGLRVEDGLERLDSYLDAAVLSGMPFGRIIHGHGTGAMKSAVREALRVHRQVRRFRPGEQGEGGDGATVVYFE